jgi:hypothetical protein
VETVTVIDLAGQGFGAELADLEALDDADGDFDADVDAEWDGELAVWLVEG